jgi:hypothetical protein
MLPTHAAHLVWADSAGALATQIAQTNGVHTKVRYLAHSFTWKGALEPIPDHVPVAPAEVPVPDKNEAGALDAFVAVTRLPNKTQ